MDLKPSECAACVVQGLSLRDFERASRKMRHRGKIVGWPAPQARPENAVKSAYNDIL